jgi:hypothetical protein
MTAVSAAYRPVDRQRTAPLHEGAGPSGRVALLAGGGQWLTTAFSEPAPVSDRTSISAYFASLCSFDVMVPM